MLQRIAPIRTDLDLYSGSVIFIIDKDGTKKIRTLDQTEAVLSPDGKKIAFFSGAAARSDSASPSASADTAGESADLYVINADGSGLRRLANATVSKAFPTWSPDGEEIASFCPAAPGLKGTDLCMIKADGTEWKRLARDLGWTLY